jgi:hypothetical protein
MGYMHVENLYKNQMILLFKECWSSEKIHGTSSNIKFKRIPVVGGGDIEEIGEDKIDITFFSDGASHEQFVALFDKKALEDKFRELGFSELTVYGEAYGGKMQGMSKTYGPNLKFIVFELETSTSWFDMPRVEHFANLLGLECVPYVKIPCTLEAINAERDRDSEVAIRNGMGPGHIREGVVLRPLFEFVHQGENGGTIRVKHKRDEFKETNTKREVNVDPTYLKVLSDAQAIADEWVTEQRLLHVLDKLPKDNENLGLVIKAMIEDVEREGAGEIVVGKETRGAISKKVVKMYKDRQKSSLTKAFDSILGEQK